MLTGKSRPFSATDIAITVRESVMLSNRLRGKRLRRFI